MEFFSSLEFYCISILVAMAVLALIFRPNQTSPAADYIVGADLTEADAQETCSVLSVCSEDFQILLTHKYITINQGDTVHLVVTVLGDKVKVVEKLGTRVAAPVGEPVTVSVSATLGMLAPNKAYHLRYESSINTKWATSRIINAIGFEKTLEMKL